MFGGGRRRSNGVKMEDCGIVPEGDVKFAKGKPKVAQHIRMSSISLNHPEIVLFDSE